MYLTDELFHAEWVPLIALDQIVKRYMQGIEYVDQQVNGYTPSAKFELSEMIRADVQFIGQPPV